jgi:hypothetical protein
MNALAAAHDAAVTSILRVHQHAACIARNRRQSMSRLYRTPSAASSTKTASYTPCSYFCGQNCSFRRFYLRLFVQNSIQQ